ncbi:hypothetical protein L195_g028713 [Trifolium pratense]|uniref:Uncharacterized protein n=1 Tax=Trifolium pratense TaxID=57577 RepID=A0A2K3L2Q1_TRIPR|nr:hypothetical protein L195_g028713 [Trifolium pratense]
MVVAEVWRPLGGKARLIDASREGCCRTLFGKLALNYKISHEQWVDLLRGIKGKLRIIDKNNKWKFGNNKTINLWIDIWLQEPSVQIFEIDQMTQEHLKTKVQRCYPCPPVANVNRTGWFDRLDLEPDQVPVREAVENR